MLSWTVPGCKVFSISVSCHSLYIYETTKVSEQSLNFFKLAAFLVTWLWYCSSKIFLPKLDSPFFNRFESTDIFSVLNVTRSKKWALKDYHCQKAIAKYNIKLYWALYHNYADDWDDWI